VVFVVKPDRFALTDFAVVPVNPLIAAVVLVKELLDVP